MSASNLIRQTHRWLSIVFTLTVIANFVVMSQGEPPGWITYAPLFPLFLLLLSVCICSCCRTPANGAAAEAQSNGQDECSK